MIRGEPAIGHEQSRANRACIRLNPYRVPTMKQSYASAGKAPRRRVLSPSGIAAIAVYGLPPPRIVIGSRASSAVRCRTCLSFLVLQYCSRRGSQLDTVRYLTGRDQSPQRYQQLARQCHDHCRLARARSAPRSACDTTAPARYLSGSLGSATPTGSARVVPARCRPWSEN
jgi:hypothetical protein